MGLTGIPLTMVSMAVFPILIGLGVEYAIQFQNRIMEELGAGKAPGDAVVSAIKNIGQPVFFSVMTTGLGFMAILTSPIPMIYDFGLMCMIGIVVCFLTALLLLTSILYLLAGKGGTIKKIDEKPGRIERAISHVAEATTRHPAVVIVALLLMVGGYALDSRVGVETDTSTFAPQDLPSVVLFRSLNAIVGYKTDDLVVEVKAPDLTSPDAIRWVEDFASYEQRNNPEVLAVSSLASALAHYNDGVVPHDRPSIERALSLMPPDIKKRYLDDFMSTGVIRMTVVSTTTDQQIRLFQRVQDDLHFRQPPAGMVAMLGGASQMALSTFGSLTSDRLSMTAWGGLCVLISLFFVYKGDWVKAVVPVIAVTIVTGLSCIVMFLLHMKYTPLSVTLGALTIGIGIDFSILHMSRYYEEKAKGYPPAEAMRIATAKIGNAIFSSASTVIAGFGALAMSNFSILSNFGLVTIIDFLLALTSAFVIMPPLLVALDTWQMKHFHKQEAVS
jgi:hydrophobe/amphiphile efflux-3 (HAE3) family protein